ncbi:MAG: DUF1295 domain-containing protein, partial [Verrucomicrobiota bacterium]
MITTLLLGWATLALLFTFGWLWSISHRNAGIVDVLWSLTLAGLVVGFALAAPGDPARRVLIAVCTGLWGLRLGWHILSRLRQEKEEDARYATLRKHWGKRATLYFLPFFQAQALANVLLAAPLLLLMQNERGLTPWDIAGAALILASVLGERAADRQLEAWKRNPANKGKTCRKGLWAWSRHPNYFFEWTHWLAYPLMGVALLGTPLAPWWPLTLLGPIVMLALLLRGTGIPHTEKQAVKSRG